MNNAGVMSNKYYSCHAARLDTIIGNETINTWMKIRKARHEYDAFIEDPFPTIQDHNQYKFHAWLKETYGISLQLEKNGVNLEFDILDEQKYCVFLLKFS